MLQEHAPEDVHLSLTDILPAGLIFVVVAVNLTYLIVFAEYEFQNIYIWLQSVSRL